MNIVIFISGSGSTMERVIKETQSGGIPNSTVVHVIASKDSAGGIAKAKALGVPVTVLKFKKDFNSNAIKFGEKIINICQTNSADLIAQLGWLVKTPVNVVNKYAGKIINQHPGILCPGYPFDFGGQGMYGKVVHEATIRFKRKMNFELLTEATVHLVNNQYDQGDIVGLRALRVLETDTAETLAERLLPLEHDLVVETIARFATNQMIVIKKNGPLIDSLEIVAYEQAIKEAKELYK